MPQTVQTTPAITLPLPTIDAIITRPVTDDERSGIGLVLPVLDRQDQDVMVYELGRIVTMHPFWQAMAEYWSSPEKATLSPAMEVLRSIIQTQPLLALAAMDLRPGDLIYYATGMRAIVRHRGVTYHALRIRDVIARVRPEEER